MPIVFALAAGADGTPATIVVDGVTYRVARVDGNGALRVALSIDADDLRNANEAYTAAQTDNSLIAAPGAGLKIYLTAISFSTEVAGSFTLHEDTNVGTPRYGPHFFPAAGGMAVGLFDPPIVFTANVPALITTDIAGDHTITIGAKVAA